MELRPGYTMTELGVLPEDWEVRPLFSIARIVGGGTPSTAISAYWDGNISWFTPSEINDEKKYVSTSNKKISDDGLKKSSAKLLPVGTILLTTRASIGLKSILLLPATTNQGFKNLIINDDIDNEFIYYLLTIFKKELLKQASGSTFLEISPRKLGEILLCLPKSLPEQHAIAAALSDVDALLDAQERLIAKKRNIKLAAMQQLLTGKTRLPGFQQNGKYKQTELGLFPEDWCHTELNMIIANIIGGGTPRRANPQFWNGNIPWVTVKDFATFSPYRTQEYITKEGIRSSATHLIPAGTLLIATRMALGKSAIYAVDVAINQDLKALFFKDYIDTKFIFYWFLWQESNIQALGSGSTVKGISLNLLKKINICCPPSLDEQRAIAAVLSDMDAELAALEARRDKLRAVKQGMMRELLTGRTRLAGAGGRHGQ